MNTNTQLRNFILETDWGWDCDDAVAIRLLSNAHKKQEINLVGINVNSSFPNSIAALDIFLRHNDISGEIPLGLDIFSDDFEKSPGYHSYIVCNGNIQRQNRDALPPFSFYRHLLPAFDDNSCQILSIGFTQCLAALLGDPEMKELICKKVSHLWVMGGKWDEEGGKEYNFSRMPPISSAASKLCSDWPTPVTLLGFEVGQSVLTGRHLPDNDLLKGIMRVHGSPNGRCSWDPMLALLALEGSPEKAGYSSIYGKAAVRKEDGANFFTPDIHGPHRYVVKTRPDSYYEEAIDSRIDP